MIVVRIWEGIGNQLFQYAFARKMHVVYQKKVLLDKKGITNFVSFLGRKDTKREYALDNFNIKMQMASDKELKRYGFVNKNSICGKFISFLSAHDLWKYRYLEQSGSATYSYNKDYFCLKGNCYIQGWFQNPQYFDDIREELLKEITPKRKIPISKELKALLSMDNLVAVHIRRGDYKYHGNCLHMNYYQRAMQYIDNRMVEPCYLFFSDDINWVKEKFGQSVRYKYIDEYGHYRDYEELFIMSKCSHIIIANSTFSWWAAWLNRNKRKIVVAPQSWYGNSGREISQQIIPKDWNTI